MKMTNEKENQNRKWRRNENEKRVFQWFLWQMVSRWTVLLLHFKIHFQDAIKCQTLAFVLWTNLRFVLYPNQQIYSSLQYDLFYDIFLLYCFSIIDCINLSLYWGIFHWNQNSGTHEKLASMSLQSFRILPYLCIVLVSLCNLRLSNFLFIITSSAAVDILKCLYKI